MDAHHYKRYFQGIVLIALSAVLSTQVVAQSPKKLFANGYYERAFIKANEKQNKKVKLKEKHANVIYKSYESIYNTASNWINKPETKWKQGYDNLILVVKYRAMAKHPMVNSKLENMLYDQDILDMLAIKFNKENEEDLLKAQGFEYQKEYIKAMDIYNKINVRQNEAKPITTLVDKLTLIDTESKIDNANQKQGDLYIAQAEKLIFEGSRESATSALDLIHKANAHRRLNAEEQELKKLAKLILGDSWLQEAKNLLQTPTKRNGRTAYELINRTRSTRALSSEEEQLLEEAHTLGMTHIVLDIKGNNPAHSVDEITGILNSKKSSQWITYYPNPDGDQAYDFVLSITANKPIVVLGDVRRRLQQEEKTVEYWEEVTDAEGNTTNVKKTKQVKALVAVVSRTKSAHLGWSVTLKDVTDGKSLYSEAKENKTEHTNEYASVESGDILALPENIESEVNLDSQPFPTDKEMSDEVLEMYVASLPALLKLKKDHMRNLDKVVQ